ncbi:MAG: iron-containing alcohol dehydrogenase [Kiritimatiellae bacterium]|nr:iron-containing alcohol dehydrogenase [Kiritimatiellia bacterium]
MSYTFHVPTKVLFGAGALKKLHEEKLPGKKALVVISNGKSTRTNGSLAALEAELDAAGVAHVLFDKIQANPLEPTVQEGVEFGRVQGVDFVVGLGGGSVMDAAKAIAAMIPQQGGRVWDYMATGTSEHRPFNSPLLPFVAITTSAGTGSEVDAGSVITSPVTHEKGAFFSQCPALAVVDPALMVTVPPKFTAYQGFDALFHNTEGYISKFGNEMGAMVELEAIRLLGKWLPVAVADGKNLKARTKVAFANTLGGYSMDVSTCTSEHAIEHALSGEHQDLPHGAGLVMISLAYYKTFIDRGDCPEKFVEMARALGKADATKPADFLDALAALQKACGVDALAMSDYGIRPEEFPGMVKLARSAVGMLFSCDPSELSDDDVLAILRASYR